MVGVAPTSRAPAGGAELCPRPRPSSSPGALAGEREAMAAAALVFCDANPPDATITALAQAAGPRPNPVERDAAFAQLNTIIRRIGSGGMGVVYKAHDTKLDRDVAIKFLPRRVAVSEEERERFTIEGRAAAALNHPHITHIYAIEELDDEMFIVMEYVDGGDLHNKIVSLAKDGR